MMQNALVNIDLEGNYKEALMDIGYDLEEIYEEEVDPALGNGGLGRLAACFLDSMTTLEIPAWGYGIRYDYGIFKKKIVDGHQAEVPDFWLSKGNPWEIERPDISYNIRFYGDVKKYQDGGIERAHWSGGE
jgi:starch phosphorylase